MSRLILESHVMKAVGKCQFCGKPLPIGEKAVRIRTWGEDRHAYLVHGDCIIEEIVKVA